MRSKNGNILLGGLLALLVLAAGAAYAAVNVWPGIGAETVDLLRGIVGDQAVAMLEDGVLKTEDQLLQWANKAKGGSQSAHWTGGEVTEVPHVVIPAKGSLPTATPAGQPQATKAAPQPQATSAGPGAPAELPTTAPQSPWQPQLAASLGGRPDEGVWQPFITNGDQVLAYRTIIVPDYTVRPYAFAAVIAFDLQNTRLHFLLGTEDPKSDVSVDRPGRIPDTDRQLGVLLAAFNGGFKTAHGHFGVMVNGTTLVPARDGMGAIGLYADGTVRMGLLGKDVPLQPDMPAWRQNGPLVIQNGAINPLTQNDDPQNWGYVVSSDTATYRSAIAISQDNRTLYYAVGPDLTLPALAQALQAIHAYQAIQLDINNYWAHFETFEPSGTGLKAVPLLDYMKGVDDQRFLGHYIRDYFYITAK